MQIKLYEAGGTRGPEDVYHAALAHMAEGFRARNPSLVRAADALLAKLEADAVGAGQPAWKIFLPSNLYLPDPLRRRPTWPH